MSIEDAARRQLHRLCEHVNLLQFGLRPGEAGDDANEAKYEPIDCCVFSEYVPTACS